MCTLSPTGLVALPDLLRTRHILATICRCPGFSCLHRREDLDRMMSCHVVALLAVGGVLNLTGVWNALALMLFAIFVVAKKARFCTALLLPPWLAQSHLEADIAGDI